MIRRLKQSIETVEALEGGKDYELRRQFNEIVGGDAGEWLDTGYAAAAWSGDAAVGAWDGTKKAAVWTGDKAGSAWDGTKKAAAWTGDKAGSVWRGTKSAAAWTGDKAGSVWRGTKWTGSKLGSALNWLDQKTGVSHRKKMGMCRNSGRNVEKCLDSPDSTYEFLKQLKRKEVERLLSTLAIRLQNLKQQEEREEREKAKVPAVVNDVAPALTDDEKRLAKVHKRMQTPLGLLEKQHRRTTTRCSQRFDADRLERLGRKSKPNTVFFCLRDN